MSEESNAENKDMISLDKLKVNTEYDKIMEAIKTLELETLIEVDRICRKNNIEYSIAGGTLLGAVRHGGFIPWDDDIDVDMVAEEYYKFVEACKKDLDTDKFILYTNKTNPNFNDFPAKVMVKDTIARSKSATAAGIPLTIGVDVFKMCHMPDDYEERAELANRLTVLSQICFAKTYNNINMITIPENRTPRAHFLVNHVPRKLIYNYIIKTENKCNKKYRDSDYITDTFIYRTKKVAGKHNFAKEGYEDVRFEGHTFRKFTDHDADLTYNYGPDYMEMPPVEARISHHKFYEFNIDKYKERFGLPDDYEKYAINKLNGEQLMHMKNLCMDMIEEVGRICEKHGIKYYMNGDDILYKARNIEEMSKLYRLAPSITMDVENLLKFNEVVKDELDPKYFYQTTETDPEYLFHYPRIVLNGTDLIDRSHNPHEIHKGLWINIGILVNAPEDKKEATDYYWELRHIHELIRYNQLYDDVRINTLKNFKLIKENNRKKRQKLINKRKAELSKINEARQIPYEELLERRKEIYTRYKDIDTPYCVEISTGMIKAPQMKKEDYGDGVKGEILGREVMLPSNIQGICDCVVEFIKARDKQYTKLLETKENDPDTYYEQTVIGTEKFLNNMNTKFHRHSLTVHDLPDYQLSVWKMDF